MLGTFLNVGGIILGGLAGLYLKPLSMANQATLKVLLGAFTVFFGLQITWKSMHGSFFQVLKQLLVVVGGLILGRLVGKLLRLQKLSNGAGKFARKRMEEIKPGQRGGSSDGFVICSLLFCVAPLAILGPVHEALGGYVQPLLIKTVVDALSMMAFVTMFGGAAIFSFVPVLAFQGLLTLGLRALEPRLHAQVDPILAAGGFLVFSVALIILGLKKIEAADYLPSLATTPLLAWLSGY